MAGTNSPNTDAATITPEANPKNAALTLAEMSFLKKNTSAEPAVVIKNIKAMPIAAIPGFVHIVSSFRNYTIFFFKFQSYVAPNKFVNYFI